MMQRFVLPKKRGRIEIIPLIDIMFFLLASFMLASLSMIRLQSIQMALPTATVATSHSKPDVITLVVNRNGDYSVGGTNFNVVALQQMMASRFKVNSNVQVYIRASPMGTYGRFVSALDLARQVGIEKVSCDLSPPAEAP